MMQKDKTYIAFVCTGNTCRSPMAEAIFNQLAEEHGLDIVAESFGMTTMTGLEVSQNSAVACSEIGIDISRKSATSANDIELEKYDKFYCMSKNHAEMLAHFYLIPISKIEVLDILDPYGGSLDVYRQCRDEIYNSVKEIIENYEN